MSEQGIRHLYHSLIWTSETLAAFMVVAPLDLQRALIMAIHTGKRQGDLLALTWSVYDGTHIRPGVWLHQRCWPAWRGLK